MLYRIEYLTETTDETSVCFTLNASSRELQKATSEAFAHKTEARRHGATGFQIRHINAVDEVIAIAGFDDGAEVFANPRA